MILPLDLLHRPMVALTQELKRSGGGNGSYRACCSGSAPCCVGRDPALADTTQEVVNKAPNGLALTPPMGWNSWNKFACNVNEQIVRDTADAMVALAACATPATNMS